MYLLTANSFTLFLNLSESIKHLKILPWQIKTLKIPFFCNHFIIFPYSFTVGFLSLSVLAFSALSSSPLFCNSSIFCNEFKFLIFKHVLPFFSEFFSLCYWTKSIKQNLRNQDLILICSLSLCDIKLKSNQNKILNKFTNQFVGKLA